MDYREVSGTSFKAADVRLTHAEKALLIMELDLTTIQLSKSESSTLAYKPC